MILTETSTLLAFFAKQEQTHSLVSNNEHNTFQRYIIKLMLINWQQHNNTAEQQRASMLLENQFKSSYNDNALLSKTHISFIAPTVVGIVVGCATY